MIIVLASPRDDAARAFASDARAALMTPSDLSCAGWRWTARHGLEQAIAAGRPLDGAAISGVLTRFGTVPEEDLGHIRAADRGFVAAEMTAFLLTWLTGLRCPVVNPPSGASLCGPGWRPARWVAAGIASARRTWPETAVPEPEHVIDVVDGRAMTVAPRAATRLAERAARVAGVPALRVKLASGARIVAADPWVAIERPEVAGAVLSALTGSRG
jgi:hypothetical protein